MSDARGGPWAVGPGRLWSVFRRPMSGLVFMGRAGFARFGMLDAARASKPIERLVPVSFMRYRTSTPGLSTWWSATALGETWF